MAAACLNNFDVSIDGNFSQVTVVLWPRVGGFLCHSSAL